MCFSVDFAKFLRTPFLQNISGRLLLHTKCKDLKKTGRKFQHAQYTKVLIPAQRSLSSDWPILNFC